MKSHKWNFSLLGGNIFSEMQNFRFKKSFAWKILYFLSTFAAILTVAGFLGHFWWVFDTVCHFRVQYFSILMLSAILFTFGKKWVACILASIFALINATIFIPYFRWKCVTVSFYFLQKHGWWIMEYISPKGDIKFIKIPLWRSVVQRKHQFGIFVDPIKCAI